MSTPQSLATLLPRAWKIVDRTRRRTPHTSSSLPVRRSAWLATPPHRRCRRSYIFDQWKFLFIPRPINGLYYSKAKKSLVKLLQPIISFRCETYDSLIGPWTRDCRHCHLWQRRKQKREKRKAFCDFFVVLWFFCGFVLTTPGAKKCGNCRRSQTLRVKDGNWSW